MAFKHHILYASTTQTGKTLTLLGVIYHRHIQSPNSTDWTIIDPKWTFWLGLETMADGDGLSSVVRLNYSDVETVLCLKAKLDFLLQKLNNRQQQRFACAVSGRCYNPKPHIVVLDEWISIRLLCERFDRAYRLKGSGSIWAYILGAVETLILNGAEDGFQVWIATQMPELEENGFSGGLRRQCKLWCLGSPEGGYRSIEAAICSPYLVPDAEVRRGLKRELRIWAEAGEWVTFSDIGGYAIFSSPLLDERLKQTHVFRGELPLLPVTAPVLETHRKREANVIPLFGDHSSPSVVAASGSQLSKGAAALLRFTHRQGRPIRLQEAYNSLSRFGKAEEVKGYAQECVEQRLAKLEENPGYRGSFLFSATGAVREAI